MTKRQYLGMMGTTVIAGLIGGALMTWLLEVSRVNAQDVPDTIVVKTIVAEQIRLVSSDQKRLAVLGSVQGESGLVLFDGEGNIAAKLTILQDEGIPMLTMGKPGDLQAVLTAHPLGTGLTLKDKVGKARLTMITTSTIPMLSLSDDNGVQRVLLMASPGPVLGFRDGNNTVRTLMGVGEAGPYVDLYDIRGNKRASLGATSLVDDTGATVSRLSESSLSLYDRKGTVLWHAP